MLASAAAAIACALLPPPLRSTPAPALQLRPALAHLPPSSLQQNSHARLRPRPGPHPPPGPPQTTEIRLTETAPAPAPHDGVHIRRIRIIRRRICERASPPASRRFCGSRPSSSHPPSAESISLEPIPKLPPESPQPPPPLLPGSPQFVCFCEILVSLTPPSPRSPFIWYGTFQKINFRLEESKMSISPCFATKTDSPRGHPIPPKTNQIAAQFSSLEYKVHCPLPPFTSRFGCRTCGSWNDNDAANPHEFACDDEASTAAA